MHKVLATPAGLADQLFTQAQGPGYGDYDMTAICKIYEQTANIKIVTGQPFQATVPTNSTEIRQTRPHISVAVYLRPACPIGRQVRPVADKQR